MANNLRFALFVPVAFLLAVALMAPVLLANPYDGSD